MEMHTTASVTQPMHNLGGVGNSADLVCDATIRGYRTKVFDLGGNGAPSELAAEVNDNWCNPGS